MAVGTGIRRRVTCNVDLFALPNNQCTNAQLSIHFDGFLVWAEDAVQCPLSDPVEYNSMSRLGISLPQPSVSIGASTKLRKGTQIATHTEQR